MGSYWLWLSLVGLVSCMGGYRWRQRDGLAVRMVAYTSLVFGLLCLGPLATGLVLWWS